jgi:hypothetical protein
MTLEFIIKVDVIWEGFIMKLIGKLFFAAAALGIILSLSVFASEDHTAVVANPIKANHQQYERIQEPALVVNSSK